MPTEEEIVALIRDMALTGKDTLVGIGDDSAVLRAGKNILATADQLVEKIHFSREYASLFQIGRKAVSVNISDIAAMGGVPKWALLCLALPGSLGTSDIRELIRGIMDRAADFGLKIVGGDLSAAGRITIGITVIGEAPAKPLLRSTAREGDKIWVTGTLGDSAAGLEALRGKLPSPFLREKHLNPTPRLEEGKILSARGLARSMMDISDGLGSDLNRLCRESKVGARIYTGRLPLSEQLRTHAPNLGRTDEDFALYGGEDYELLFTAPVELSQEIVSALEIPVTAIGEIVPPREGVQLVHGNGKPEPLKWGFDHFKG